jgi:DNA mismatch endonuclease, patch repair protein
LADWLTPQQRSYNMSRIRSRGNSTTELTLIKIMRNAGLKGWRRNSELPGRPDFVFPKRHMAVFVDGCFWHGCPKCYVPPRSNRPYWSAKVTGNRARDRRRSRELRLRGWRVVRLWEHLLAQPAQVVRRLVDRSSPAPRGSRINK